MSKTEPWASWVNRESTCCWSIWRSIGSLEKRLRSRLRPKKTNPPKKLRQHNNQQLQARRLRQNSWTSMMKKIEAIFKPFKLDEIKEALANERIQRFSLF